MTARSSWGWPPLELPGSDALGVDALLDEQAAGFFVPEFDHLPPHKPAWSLWEEDES